MATESENPGKSTRSNGISSADYIRQIAAKNARASLNDEEQLTLFLQSWWSRTYNRPLKDELLKTYTLEELLYEFYDRIERKAAEEEMMKQEEIKEEEAKEKENLDWAEQMEKQDLEEMKAKAAAEASKNTDPTKDPENIKWMEEQIRLAKTELGETFGEDIEVNFDEE